MKQNPDSGLWFLVGGFLLVGSIVLNCCQQAHIDKLLKEREELEQTQSILYDRIADYECEKGETE